MRQFPYGKAALCILIAALIAGLWLAAHPVKRKTATLTFWTFAKNHYDSSVEAAKSFEKLHPGVKVDVQLVAGPAVTYRLQAAFWSDLDVPDLAETEISAAGMFFRGPLEHVGFVDLTDRIHKEGLWDGMVQSRFAPYMSRGHIFGLPNDIHPVMLAYRRDIFEKKGVDVGKIKTWDDFVAVGRKLTIPNKRYMIEFSDSASWSFEMLLFQRGGGYFDSKGNCTMDDEIAVQTMCWYVPLVAGSKKIANSLGAGQGSGQMLTRAVEDGYILCLIAPDWRTKQIEMDVPRMSGKMALMPLPTVTPGGRPTSTWGGTMVGITKHCRNQDLAWEFAKHLYLESSDLAERFRSTNTLPALRSAWKEPAFNEPRPYWSGQQIGTMYASLARDVPPQYTSPVVVTAKSKLGEAIVECVQRYNAYGDEGFEEFVRSTLKNNAEEVRAMIRRNPY
jgi:arabinosaccharide transport system substrate-binding protein